MEPDALSALQAKIDELRARLVALEQKAHGQTSPVTLPLAAHTVAPDVPHLPLVAPTTKPQRDLLFASGFGEEPQPAGKAGAEARQNHSLETRIGSQWFNRIGIVAVLIAMAWFLKLAIDSHWIGPLGRVLIGLLAGTGIVAWSQRLRKSGSPIFAYSLQALGSGILYLSLWAAFSVYQLLPSGAAFAAMIAVTAFNGYMAWTLDAQVLAVYSLVGGMGTPLLLSTGHNSQAVLFSYLLLLDCAVLVLTTLRPWSRLLVGAFFSTALYASGWSLRFYTDQQRLRTAVFFAIFFLLFAFSQRLIRWRADGEEVEGTWDRLAVFVVPVVNAGLGFFAFYGLFREPRFAWLPPWLAVMFAAFYLLLLRLPARGVLRPNSAASSALSLSLAVSFLAVAVPLKTHSRGLPIGWLIEGAVFLWVAQRFGQRLLRGLAMVCLLVGLGALLLMNSPANVTPLLNQRFATYCTAIAVFAFAALLARRSRDTSGEHDVISWSTIGPAAVLVMNALILVAVGWEIHNYWWFVRWHGTTHLMHNYRMYAQFTYSAFFMLFGASLLGVGFTRHSAFMRWQGLVLLAAAIAKVFLGDVSSLSQGYRILSFLALGVLLLAVSFAYQRDWLHLRAQEDETA